MNNDLNKLLNNDMSSKLQAAMRKATQLTSSGDLQGATAAIQQSLNSGAFPAFTEFRPGHQGADSGRWYSDPDVVSVQTSANASNAGSHAHAHAGTHAGAHAHPHAEHPASEAQPAGSVSYSKFSSHGMTLEYRLFTPLGVSGPTPLLMMLHGCTQDADDFAVGTDMDAVAGKAGIKVLYVSQSAQRNNRKCWNWFEPAHQQRGAGEVAALHALCNMAVSRHEIAPGQIFVAGMSAGGAMALVLADQYPELVAGVGVHSGLPYGVARSVPQALSAMQGARRPPPGTRPTSDAAPSIIFHGNADSTVHPCNAEQIVAARITHAETTTIKTRGTQAGRSFKRDVHRTGDDRVACEYWQLDGTGHNWSGGNPAGSYTDQAGPSASAEMVRFFSTIIDAG